MSGASAERKAQAKARYEYLKARGRCVKCAKPAFAGRTLCAECLYKKTLRNIDYVLTDEQKAKEYRRKKERYLERKAAGLCVICGKPAANGCVRCVECLLKDRLAQREYAREKRAAEPEKAPRAYTTPPVHSQAQTHPWKMDNRIVFGRYV